MTGKSIINGVRFLILIFGIFLRVTHGLCWPYHRLSWQVTPCDLITGCLQTYKWFLSTFIYTIDFAVP